MDAEFKQFLSPDIRLPTIPGVAQQILLLANNPDSTTAELVKILSKDPAIAGTILRYVNSPTYAVPGEIDSIERAAGIMGFDNIISIALSFTLVSSPENQQRSGLDYPLLWQRSMLCAIAAKTIGASAGLKELDPLFLAGLLQDIGMLALDVTKNELYAPLSIEQLQHERISKHEKAELSIDHAQTGGWLLKEWRLPTRIVTAVAQSHHRHFSREGDRSDPFNTCVAISGMVSDFFLDTDNSAEIYPQYLDAIKQGLRIEAEDANQILKEVQKDLDLLPGALGSLTTNPDEARLLKKLAGKALSKRHLVPTNPVSIDISSTEFDQLKQSDFLGHIDKLTGILSPKVFQAKLEAALLNAPNKQLNVALVKINNLHKIEIQHGGKVASLLLRAVGRNLTNSLHDKDFVTRYGDTFGIALVSAAHDGAYITITRILESFDSANYSAGPNRPFALAFSAGLVIDAPSNTTSFEEGMQMASNALNKTTQSKRIVSVESTKHH